MEEQIVQHAVAVNSFVRRQTRESPYSYYAGDLDTLACDVSLRLANGEGRQGYREGVMLVSVPPARFFTSIVAITDDTLIGASFEARREGEEKHIVVRAHGEKMPAKHVEIVLYRRDVLGADERSLSWLFEPTKFAEWEIISINARATEEEEPMDPLTMARNYLEKTGGTKGVYTAQQFADSIWYWSQRALSSGG